MPPNTDGILWLFLSLVPLLALQRSLHREIQAFFLLLTRRVDIALTLFAILFFPGVLLHEGSHYIIAFLLGVPRGSFSLIPRPVGEDKLQLGSVETEQSDWLRDALIGMAPLLCGGAFVAFVGVFQLHLVELGQTLWEQGVVVFSQAFGNTVALPDFWLWVYLALVVSSTMLPSASDRRAWLPLGLLLGLLLVLSLLIGAGPWLAENLVQPFNLGLRAVALVFTMSAVLHLFFLPVFWLLRKVLGEILGREVVL
jgi:hypothetical protein